MTKRMIKNKTKEDRAKVIEMTDVVADYGRRMVLNGINISVYEDEIIFISTVSEVKRHKSTYIQNLLNRSVEDGEIHPEKYLRRLTGDGSVKELNL
jgi:ABC-type transporter Mla maintaining outer membrane lipid asymmetry ATPase subunit MlaF